MGSPTTMWITPGRLRKARRPQHSPEVGRHRDHRHPQRVRQRRDARLQVEHGAWRPARAFWENDDLPLVPHRPLAFPQQAPQGGAAGATVDGDHPGALDQRAEQRNLQQLLSSAHSSSAAAASSHTKVSNADWWRDAISAAPGGMCSSPVTSSRMPQIIRSAATMNRAQNIGTVRVRSGVTTRMTVAISVSTKVTAEEHDVERHRADQDHPFAPAAGAASRCGNQGESPATTSRYFVYSSARTRRLGSAPCRSDHPARPAADKGARPGSACSVPPARAACARRR